MIDEIYSSYTVRFFLFCADSFTYLVMFTCTVCKNLFEKKSKHFLRWNIRRFLYVKNIFHQILIEMICDIMGLLFKIKKFANSLEVWCLQQNAKFGE